MVVRLQALQTFETLQAWGTWLAQPGDWVGGFDLPFGLSRELVQTLHWPTDWAACMDVGGRLAGSVSGSMNMMGNLGAWAFPIATPMLLAHFKSWDAVVVVFGTLYLLAAAFWLIATRRSIAPRRG